MRYLEGWTEPRSTSAPSTTPASSDREICEVTITGPGHVVRAKVAAADQFAAIDAAVAKLEHQLHKLKTRLVARQQGKRHPVHQGQPDARASTATSPATSRAW